MDIREIIKREALNNGKLFNIKRRRARKQMIYRTLTNIFESPLTNNKISNPNEFLFCGNGNDYDFNNDHGNYDDYDDDDDDDGADGDDGNRSGNFGKLARQQCGFKRSFEKKTALYCHHSIDQRAVVSLALVKRQSTILGAYANKLPIMTLNVSRFMYTVEAFVFRNYTPNDQTAIQQALDFYVRTDIENRNNKLQPNLQFSEFLHCLRSSGYLKYIFALARKLNLNVDLVIDSSLVARYIRVDVHNVNTPSIGIGYLTVVHPKNGSDWYVKTTKEPIVTDEQANAQAIADSDPFMSMIHFNSNLQYTANEFNRNIETRQDQVNRAKEFLNSLK